MGGFIGNNGTGEVMLTYSPDQVPVLNGLARAFAVTDEWFSSMVGATDANRAFSLTGSAMLELDNFHEARPSTSTGRAAAPRVDLEGAMGQRQHGLEDLPFRRMDRVRVHVSAVPRGTDPDGGHADVDDYIAGIEQFIADARAGKLPAFSYLEPFWIAPAVPTSYHPGEDVVPAERQLNAIYDALRHGPAWEETLLVITFDEHGGIYDHVPPPYAENPWPTTSRTASAST